MKFTVEVKKHWKRSWVGVSLKIDAENREQLFGKIEDILDRPLQIKDRWTVTSYDESCDVHIYLGTCEEPITLTREEIEHG